MRRQLIAAGLALLTLAVPAFRLQQVLAAPGLSNRSIAIGSSRGSEVTTYDFQFDLTIPGTLGSVRFEFCSNNPLPFQPCAPPVGLDISGVNLVNQTGETGFVINGATTTNDLLISRTPAALTPQTVNYDFDNAVNPTNIGSYFVRVITYTSDDGTGPSNEEAGLAFAITIDDFNIAAFVPPFLEFCVGITITSSNCATATGDAINFGTLSSNTVKFATSQMAAGTNGVGGVAITVIGTTMTSGIHTIDALTSPAASNPGANQFGLNLRNNSSPNVGANSTGLGTTAPVGNYNVPNQFTFNNGDLIANSPISTNFNTLTASYIVNVDEDQNPGVYTSTITYVATATF